MLFRVFVPLILIAIAAFAVVGGIVHLTVGAIKLLFGVLVLILVVSMFAGRGRTGRP